MSVCQAQNTAVTPDEFQTNSVTLCEVSQKNTCKLIRHESDQHVGGSSASPVRPGCRLARPRGGSDTQP